MRGPALAPVQTFPRWAGEGEVLRRHALREVRREDRERQRAQAFPLRPAIRVLEIELEAHVRDAEKIAVDRLHLGGLDRLVDADTAELVAALDLPRSIPFQ